jgi:uncharacterized protein (TIGR02996 family)
MMEDNLAFMVGMIVANLAAAMYVLKLVVDYANTHVREMRRRYDDLRDDIRTSADKYVTRAGKFVVDEVETRIAEFAGMSDEERAFFVAAVKRPKDRALFLVLADWLEEQNRMEESARIRLYADKLAWSPGEE